MYTLQGTRKNKLTHAHTQRESGHSVTFAIIDFISLKFEPIPFCFCLQFSFTHSWLKHFLLSCSACACVHLYFRFLICNYSLKIYGATNGTKKYVNSLREKKSSMLTVFLALFCVLKIRFCSQYTNFGLKNSIWSEPLWVRWPVKRSFRNENILIGKQIFRRTAKRRFNFKNLDALLFNFR